MPIRNRIKRERLRTIWQQLQHWLRWLRRLNLQLIPCRRFVTTSLNVALLFCEQVGHFDLLWQWFDWCCWRRRSHARHPLRVLFHVELLR